MSARECYFHVHGLPAPQGSKRHVGRGVMIESSKRVAPWREAVKWAAIETMRAQRITRPLDGPLSVRMVFALPRPASAPRSRRHPDRKPDLDKLLRSTMDALTDAGLIADDARVVEFTRLAKVYAFDGPGGVDFVGAVIHVAMMEDGA